MSAESLKKDVYSEIAEASGVDPESVQKVLDQLGFTHAVNNITRMSGRAAPPSISAKQLSVEIMLDKAILVK